MRHQIQQDGGDSQHEGHNESDIQSIKEESRSGDVPENREINNIPKHLNFSLRLSDEDDDYPPTYHEDIPVPKIEEEENIDLIDSELQELIKKKVEYTNQRNLYQAYADEYSTDIQETDALITQHMKKLMDAANRKMRHEPTPKLDEYK